MMKHLTSGTVKNRKSALRDDAPPTPRPFFMQRFSPRGRGGAREWYGAPGPPAKKLQDAFFGPGATKCRIGNVKKPTMQDARAGAPNKKGYARAGAQGKPDAPGQRKKSNAKRTRRDAN